MSVQSFGHDNSGMVSKEMNRGGSRPTPLMVNKNSSVIKKPVPRRSPAPVITYLRSPKIINVSPQEFMGLVQRLTGKD
ncbi:hypothetical protein ACSBR1_021084 [Camellia fascicularis]